MEYSNSCCMISFIVCAYCVAVSLGQGPPAYSIDLESQLRDEIFKNYSPLQRPAKTVNVKVDLTLLTVNDLSIKDQTLSVSALLTLRWLDARLAWLTGRSQDYSSITYMYDTEKNIWKPSIYVENSVVDLSVITDPNTPMRMDQKGEIRWSTSAIYIVSCESEIMYYPLDEQICDIKLTTAGYTAVDINLTFDPSPVTLAFYAENGEWELLTVQGMKLLDKYVGGAPQSKVLFRINMRRRPLFHILNTMFPVVLMAFLIPMAFKLHVESGEKMGYSLTVLLAYAVYLSMISENIPSTSVSICFLSIYLASTLALSTLSVLFVIIVINIHHTPEEEPMSPRLQSIGFKLERCLCRKKKDASTQPVKVAPAPNDSLDKPDMTLKDNFTFEEEDIMTWIRLSRVLDRFFFVLFMITITFSTLIFTALTSSKLVTY